MLEFLLLLLFVGAVVTFAAVTDSDKAIQWLIDFFIPDGR